MVKKQVFFLKEQTSLVFLFLKKTRFSFFNNHIVNANIDINLRKKINLDFKKNEKLDTKIIKFLFTETFPKIYLEGFATQKKNCIKFLFTKKNKWSFYLLFSTR